MKDLRARISMSQSSISAALGVLEGAGLVVGSERGYVMRRTPGQVLASEVLEVWRSRASLHPAPDDAEVAALWRRLVGMSRGLDVPLETLLKGGTDGHPRALDA